MLKAFSTPRNRTRSFSLIVLCAVLAAGASLVGIDDNVPGLTLAGLAAISFFLIFAHPWRSSQEYGRLTVMSGIGFVVSVILHNVFEAIAMQFDDASMPRALFDGLGVVFFFGVLMFPLGALVGFVGRLVASRLGDTTKKDSA